MNSKRYEKDKKKIQKMRAQRKDKEKEIEAMHVQECTDDLTQYILQFERDDFVMHLQRGEAPPESHIYYDALVVYHKSTKKADEDVAELLKEVQDGI